MSPRHAVLYTPRDVERWTFRRDSREFRPDRSERFVREGERWIER